MRLPVLDKLGWRQPRKQESLAGAAAFATLSLIVFFALCYPELRKNLVYLPATCEPFANAVTRPEIRPYRHCYQSCFGCLSSWSPTPCTFKLGMHRSINEYDMQASWYIAGSCGGASCCQKEVCKTCTKVERRCTTASDGSKSCRDVSTSYSCDCHCAPNGQHSTASALMSASTASAPSAVAGARGR